MSQKQLHPFLESLEKKIRNISKKKREIEDLEKRKKAGEVLKQEQIDKISEQTKLQIQNQLDEINKYRTLFLESEKQDQESQETTTKKQLQNLVKLLIFQNTNTSDDQSHVQTQLNLSQLINETNLKNFNDQFQKIQNFLIQESVCLTINQIENQNSNQKKQKVVQQKKEEQNELKQVKNQELDVKNEELVESNQLKQKQSKKSFEEIIEENGNKIQEYSQKLSQGGQNEILAKDVLKQDEKKNYVKEKYQKRKQSDSIEEGFTQVSFKPVAKTQPQPRQNYKNK